MLSSFISKLSNAFCGGLRGAVIGQEFRVRVQNFKGVCFIQPLNTVVDTRSNIRIVNQKRTLTTVGCVSIPFVSGQIRQDSGCQVIRTLMAVTGSSAVLGDLHVDDLIASAGNLGSFTRTNGVFFNDRSLHSCQKARVRLRTREPSNHYPVCAYFAFVTRRQPCSSYSSKEFHSLASACYAAAAPDVPPEGSSVDEQLGISSVLSEQEIPAEGTLKLVSGSCYLPHPDKEDTGGEDAHFICIDEQAIGVADGVGGWAELGINAGEYARQLMSNSVGAIQEEPKGSIDPARVLEKAHSSTKAKGSSTACIIALRDEGIQAINLGDSGFIVVRDGYTIFQSPVQQHGFNFTYQLANSSEGDLPSSGQLFTISVAPGDVIVAGTDGLFDNLYNNEITSIVLHAVRAGLSPQVTAQKIAALARERGQNKTRQTPFATAAQEAGFRYYGGKLDDITVVVSYISSFNDAFHSSPCC
ncbi:PPM-type phosphatase-like domain [Dillenia turbinata]|uniref:Protein phosphatase n=1 Tax=Dillenia turbinata TaxID=194707 RepID=A0AAN8V4V9_9MAGN